MDELIQNMPFQKHPPYLEVILSFSSELVSPLLGMAKSPPAIGHQEVQVLSSSK